MGAIFRHELRNYFHSLTAYVFGAFLLAVVGLGSVLYNLQAAVSNFEFVLSFASIIFVVIVPILTMRTLAEERRQRTDQLLYSLPITTTQVVLGKYFALLVVYLIPLAVVSLYSYSTSFDGEGAITSAIDYVVNEEQPKLYLVEGHGEADLPSTFAEQVEKDNIETESLSLLHTETIPEDADCLMIYAPESDISEDERDLLAEYVSGGGKLLVIAGPTREDGILENLYSLLSDYGVEPAEGIVVESDSNYYSAFSGPAALLPQLQSDDITDSLIGSNYSVIMPIALGLIVDDSASGTVTELLTTSGTSFSKVTGYAMTTYDYEDGDIDGPFATGVSVRPGDGEMVWFTSSYFLEDAYNASSSGANGDLVMNALADMIGESEAMAIRSKSLNYDYLSISSSTASLLKVLMIGAFPLAYLGIGVGVVLTRRRKQNEAV